MEPLGKVLLSFKSYFCGAKRQGQVQGFGGLGCRMWLLCAEVRGFGGA